MLHNRTELDAPIQSPTSKAFVRSEHSVGLAVATGSAMRLLLKAALWILFDVMVEFEEGALLDEYTARVPTKFVPSAFLELLEG